MRFAAVLLDMGGVLIDFGTSAGLPSGRPDWRGREALARHLSAGARRVRAEELEEVLFAPWRAEYEHRYETGRDPSWEPHLERVRRRYGVSTSSERLLEIWFEPFASGLEAIPGARAALDELDRREFGLALISNVPLPGALYRRVLERLGMERQFDVLRFSYDAGSRKPSPAMLRSALEALGAPPHLALMVGDRPQVDTAAGRVAGTATAWVRSDHREGPKADLEVARLAELPSRLA